MFPLIYGKMKIGDNMNLEDIEVKKELRIVFMGTPDFAVPVLEGLAKEYPVFAVVSQPDRKKGRNGEIKSTPIKAFAKKENILIIQPEKIKEAETEIFAWRPDLIVTCAYGQILPPTLLMLPKLGCINVHASLLPKLRGGAPIHRAILNGHDKTGITIMYMDKRMDAGDIIAQAEIKIEEEDTASTLHEKLSLLGRDLLLKTLPSILDGTCSRQKQEESEVTYALNISKEDEKIHFSKTKREIYNQIRGLNHFPGAYAILDGKRLKVWEAYTTDHFFSNLLDGEITAVYPDGFGVKVPNGEIVFKTVQPEGKTSMSGASFANGYPNGLVGKILE